MSRRRAVAVAGVLAVVLAGCGIPVDSVPRQLPTGGASPAAPPGEDQTSQPAQAEVTLWFVKAGLLVPTPRTTAPPVTSQRLIDLLVAGPTEDERATGVRSAVVSVVTGEPLVVTADAAGVSTSSSVSSDEVAIVLQPEFTDLLAQEQVLVLGEVVTTVAVGPIKRVLFVNEDGQTLGVPTADGRLRNGPVTAADYASLKG